MPENARNCRKLPGKYQLMPINARKCRKKIESVRKCPTAQELPKLLENAQQKFKKSEIWDKAKNASKYAKMHKTAKKIRCDKKH